MVDLELVLLSNLSQVAVLTRRGALQGRILVWREWAQGQLLRWVATLHAGRYLCLRHAAICSSRLFAAVDAVLQPALGQFY